MIYPSFFITMWNSLKNIFKSRAPRKKIYIHAGTHKTGSTYFQEHLYKNQKLLRANGVLFSDIGLGLNDEHNRHAHRKIGLKLLKDNNEFENLFEPIVRELLDDTNLHTAIISYEGFCLPKYVEAMHKVMHSFNDVDLHVIFVFRPHVNFAISLYREICQNLKYRPHFHQFYTQALQFDRGWPWILNYHRIVATWQKIVAKRNIHVLAYVNIKGDISSHILKTMGIDMTLVPLNNSRKNPTLSAPLAELMRVINFSDWPHSKLQAFGRELLFVDQKNPQFNDYCEITPENVKEIEKAFSKDRKQLLQLFSKKIAEKDLKLNGAWKWGVETHVEDTLSDTIAATKQHLKDSKQQERLVDFEDALDQAYTSDLKVIRQTWPHKSTA